MQQPHADYLQDSRTGHRVHNISQFYHARVPPQAVVQPKSAEHQQRTNNIDAYIFPQRLQKHRINPAKLEIHAHPKGASHAAQDDAHIQEQLYDGLRLYAVLFFFNITAHARLFPL